MISKYYENPERIPAQIIQSCFKLPVHNLITSCSKDGSDCFTQY